MISIRFIPIFEDKEFIDAAIEYQAIWEAEGERIIDAFKKLTGLSLLENRIAVIVYKGISYSGRSVNDVIKLRASYDPDVKKGALIHELSHRLLFNLKLDHTIDEHSILDLFLYDIWTELYGKDFADKMVETEKIQTERYKLAWEEALSYNKEQRKERFREIQSK